MNSIDIASVLKDTLELEADALSKRASNIDDELVKAIELINSSNRLVIVGVGKSGLVGQKIAATLASTGKKSIFVHATEAMHGDLGMLDKSDLVLAISFSGYTKEVVELIPNIKRLGYKIVSMTGDKNSALSQMSDLNIDVSIDREACPLNTAPTTSTTLTMAMGDAIASALMKLNSFSKEDFAAFHPGGSLGKKLFVKVKDILQSDNLPLLEKDRSLKEAIFIMSEKRLGNAIFVDDSNRLEAILSDGDLRRAMSKDSFNIDEKAFNYATKGPFCIDDSNMLAMDLLKIMEERKIQLGLVVDSDKKLLGVVHLHKLIELGISI